MRWRITIRVEHGKPWNYVEDRHETRLKDAVAATIAHFRELHADVPEGAYRLDQARALPDVADDSGLVMHPVRRAEDS